MKTAKIVGVLLAIYILVVVAFESLLGYNQPEFPGTLILTTTDEGGKAHDRVLSGLESDGQLYVAVNHWPRAWYHRALDNPNVQVTRDGNSMAYIAVLIADAEHDRVAGEHPTGIVFRILTGFPPRHFIRLDKA